MKLNLCQVVTYASMLFGVSVGLAQASPQVEWSCSDGSQLAHFDNLAVPNTGMFTLVQPPFSDTDPGRVLVLAQGTLDTLHSTSEQMTFIDLKDYSGARVNPRQATSFSVIFNSAGAPASLVLRKKSPSGRTIQLNFKTNCTASSR